jgi:betaine-homocysteine S-methyltransferase
LPAQSYEGDSAADCAKRLADAGADIVGVNCLNGPEQQLPIAREMREAVGGYVASQPVAYRTSEEQPDFTAWPNFPYEMDAMQATRHEMAEFTRRASDDGIRYIGSCCGSVAGHVRAMAKVLGKLPEAERPWRSSSGKVMSAYEYHDHTETEV